MLFVCKYNTFALCTLQFTNLLFAVLVYLEAYRVIIVYDRRDFGCGLGVLFSAVYIYQRILPDFVFGLT